MLVLAQFAGTSLWFAGNAVLADLQAQSGLAASAVSLITSSVQLGFIAGTLVFALLALADRVPGNWLFSASAMLGAGCNAAVVALDGQLPALLALRFAVGFFLAGVYPVGMKLAASWYQPTGAAVDGRPRWLGRAMAFLVGALVLGTAFPHLVRAAGSSLPWRTVLLLVSLVACAGAVALLLLVPEGGRLPAAGARRGAAQGGGLRLDPRSLLAVFRVPAFCRSAFGYFGHMWELYAMWAFVPVIVAGYLPSGEGGSVSGWAFAIIAAGAFGCAAGGVVAPRVGSARVAVLQLAVSGLCCALLPLIFGAPPWLFFGFLLLWGVAVVGDSPQYSALNAAAAPPAQVGSALTLVVSLGFGLTIGSIELLGALSTTLAPRFLGLPLLVGPLLGLLAMRPLVARRPMPGLADA